jgi:hypothetical protein
VLVVSVPAGPVVGIASFALVAAIFPSVAWALGLVALLGVPALGCYVVGRRLGGRELGNAAATVATLSSIVTAVVLVLFALSRASFA